MLGANPPASPHPLLPGLRCKPPYNQLLIGVAGHRVVAPSSPVIHSSLSPFEQLLVVEGSGAMGIIISPLSLSSSCPVLAVLVLVLVLLVLASVLLLLSPPLPSLPLLARRRHGDSDRPVSTHSTLRARAHSGGRRVLGCGLILVVSAHLAF